MGQPVPHCCSRTYLSRCSPRAGERLAGSMIALPGRAFMVANNFRTTWQTPTLHAIHRLFQWGRLEQTVRLSQNTMTGRGTPLPGPSPVSRYPMESRFTLLAQDMVQMGDLQEVRAPTRVDRRFGDLFGATSVCSGMCCKRSLVAGT
jgi:hypothetical protein